MKGFITLLVVLMILVLSGFQTETEKEICPPDETSTPTVVITPSHTPEVTKVIPTMTVTPTETLEPTSTPTIEPTETLTHKISNFPLASDWTSVGCQYLANGDDRDLNGWFL